MKRKGFLGSQFWRFQNIGFRALVVGPGTLGPGAKNHMVGVHGRVKLLNLKPESNK